MRVLVTGATSYLGGHVVTALAEEGHEVFCTGSRDPDCWMEVLRRDQVESVVHLAWYSRAGNCDEGTHMRCLHRTIVLVDHCAPRAIPVVFASTASVYGVSYDRSVTEEDVLWPNCDYTSAKATAERIVTERMRCLGCVLRFGSLMGRGVTRDKTDVVVNAFAADAYQGRTVRVWHPGAWKPVLHVRDAAGLISLAVKDGWSGTYNAASQSVTAGDVARLVQLQTGCDVEHVEGSPNGERSCRLDCSKLRAKVPYAVWREIPEAVAEFSNYTPREGDRTTPWTQTP